jgi:hypothetical protein
MTRHTGSRPDGERANLARPEGDEGEKIQRELLHCHSKKIGLGVCVGRVS